MDVKYILDNPERVQEYMAGLMRDNAALWEEIKDVEECLAECRKDAERYRFIKNEHERDDPVGRVVWKKGANRNGHEWVDIASSTAIDALIDYEIDTTNIDTQ